MSDEDMGTPLGHQSSPQLVWEEAHTLQPPDSVRTNLLRYHWRWAMQVCGCLHLPGQLESQSSGAWGLALDLLQLLSGGQCLVLSATRGVR